VGTGGLTRGGLDTLLGPEETGLPALRRNLLREGPVGAGLFVTLRVCSCHRVLFWWWGFSAGTASASNVICGLLFFGGWLGGCGVGGVVLSVF
jgi:hypothetical protein